MKRKRNTGTFHTLVGGLWCIAFWGCSAGVGDLEPGNIGNETCDPASGAGADCVEGVCVSRECVPDETRCDGDLQQICGRDGTFVAGTDCAAQGQGCLRGICTDRLGLDVPEQVVVECAGNGGADLEGESIPVRVINGDRSGLSATVEDEPLVFPRFFALGDTTIHWRVESERDGLLRTATATTTVTVEDTIPPSSPVSSPRVVEALASTGTPVSLVPPVFVDQCSDGPISVDDDAPALFALGDTTVRFEGTDAQGNVAIATQVVTVVDTTPPEVHSPMLINAPVLPDCTAWTLPELDVSDNAYPDEDLIVSVLGAPSDGCWSQSLYVLTWLVVDPSGNRREFEQAIQFGPGTLRIQLVRITEQRQEVMPGRYYNAPLALVVRVFNGAPDYELFVVDSRSSTVTPESGSGVFEVEISEDGDYLDYVVWARDALGRVGVAELRPNVGIDTRAPQITMVEPAQDALRPYQGTQRYRLYEGESFLMNRVAVADVPNQIVSFERAIRFEGTEILTSEMDVTQTYSGLTISAWIRARAHAPGQIIRHPDFALTIDGAGRPSCESAGGATRPGVPLTLDTWHHLYCVVSGDRTRLFVDGERYGYADGAALTRLTTPDAVIGQGLVADLAHLQISTSSDNGPSVAPTTEHAAGLGVDST